MKKFRKMVDSGGNSYTNLPWLGLHNEDPTYRYEDEIPEYSEVYGWERWDNARGYWEKYDSIYWTEEDFRNPNGKWRNDWLERYKEHEAFEKKWEEEHKDDDKELIIGMLIFIGILWGILIVLKMWA